MNKIKEPISDIPADLPPVEEPIVEKKAKTPAKPSAFGNWLAQNMSKESALSILPFLFFLTILGMLYIANKHYAEKNIRQIEKINKELKELKWEHLTAKSILMSKSKQSEVAKITKTFGLNEAVTPPTKIVVNSK
jgi:Bacteriodetes cell division protein (FtsL-like)